LTQARLDAGPYRGQRELELQSLRYGARGDRIIPEIGAVAARFYRRVPNLDQTLDDALVRRRLPWVVFTSMPQLQYPNLHSMIKVAGQQMVTPAQFDDKDGDHATVEKYSDDHHGFMRLEVTDTKITGRYYEVPRPQEPYSKGSQLLDYFEFDWKKRRYLPNKP